VGEASQTYHYVDGGWTLVPAPPYGDLTAVYGFGSNDVWAVGLWDQVIHWDGSSWSLVPVSGGVGGAGLFALWGMSSDDVWAAGDQYWSCTGCGAPVIHFDGGTWSSNLPGVNWGAGSNVNAIWGTSSSDVWFDDNKEAFYYWDGGDLARGAVVPSDRGLWGSAPNSYWAGGRNGAILHFDGNSWSAVAYPGNIAALWGVSDQQMWAVGMAAGPDGGLFSWQGGSDLFFGNETTWVTQPSPQSPSHSLLAIHGSSASNVWAAGTTGTLLHFDGGTWAVSEPTQTVPSDWGLSGVWGTGPTNVWAVGNVGQQALMFHWDGGVWVSSTLDAGYLYSLHGTGPDDIWAVGSSDVLHFDGTRWTERNAGITAALTSIWAVSPTEAWGITGDATIYHWTPGTNWSLSSKIPNTVGAPLGPTAVWASSATNVYAGAFYGLAHWDGAYWSLSDGGFAPPSGERIWGSGPNDVYFDVGNGVVDHFDGAHWAPVTALNSVVVAGISGSGPNDVWVLESYNNLTPLGAHHWDGVSWTTSSLPAGYMNSVYAADPHVVWIVGGNADILRHTH
jgi:hypothetical protein